jgi:hypothetical protein
MDFDPGLAQTMVTGLVEHADAANTFVRIDMEGSFYSKPTRLNRSVQVTCLGFVHRGRLCDK